MCQMSFGVCAAQIFPLDILLVVCRFSCLCCTKATFSKRADRHVCVCTAVGYA